MNPEQQPTALELLSSLEEHIATNDVLEVSRTLLQLQGAAQGSEFAQEMFTNMDFTFAAINKLVAYAQSWTDLEWTQTYNLGVIEHFAKFFGDTFCHPLQDLELKFSISDVQLIYQVKNDFINPVCEYLIGKLPNEDDIFDNSNTALRAMLEHIYPYTGELKDLDFLLPILDRLDTKKYILSSAFDAISETLMISTVTNHDTATLINLINLSIEKGRKLVKILNKNDSLDAISLRPILFQGKNLVALNQILQGKVRVDSIVFQHYQYLSLAISNMTFGNTDDTF